MEADKPGHPSERASAARSELRVNAPTPVDEFLRQTRFRQLGYAPGQSHPPLDEIVKITQTLLNAPSALITLIDAQLQYPVSKVGLEIGVIPREHSFCGHAILGHEPMAVEDATRDPRFSGNPLVEQAEGIRAYLGVPLLAAPGKSAVGALCVIDKQSRTWSDEERVLLKRLATIVDHYLRNMYAQRCVEDSPLAMLNIDALGRCLHANPAFSRLLGRDGENMRNKKAQGFLIPADRAVFESMLRVSLQGKDLPTRRVLRFVRADGQVVKGGTSMSPLKAIRDQAVCVIRDISLEQRLEGRSRVVDEVKRELQAPLSKAVELIDALKLDGDDHAPNSVGQTVPIRRHLDELDDLIHHRLGDIAKQVTIEEQLEASEQRLRSVLEHMTLPLWVLDDRGRIVDINGSAARMSPHESESLIGKSMAVVIDGFTLTDCEAWFQKASDPTARDVLSPDLVVRFPHSDGSFGKLELRFLLMDWNGPRRLVVLGQELNDDRQRVSDLKEERTRLQRKLRFEQERWDVASTLEQQLKRSLEEKVVLLQEVHHRVKNNLQIVSSLLTLQLDQLPEGPGRVYLAESVSRVRAMALVHQHLYGSVSLQRVDLSSFMTQLVETIRNSMSPSSVVDIACDPIEVDVHRASPIGLLVNELMTNAFKYGASEDGKVRVNIRCHKTDNAIELTIYDDGPGLPEDFNLDGDTQSLGTKLIRSLSRQLKGEVSARTDRGARFDFTFPIWNLDDGTPYKL